MFEGEAMSEVAEKLLKETFRNPATECLEWIGSTAKSRPMIKMNGKLVSVRRIVYLGLHPEEDVPERDTIKNACKCLNCIEPKHMYRTSFGKTKPVRHELEDDEDDDLLNGVDVLTKLMTPEYKKTLAEQTVQRAMQMRNPLESAWSAFA